MYDSILSISLSLHSVYAKPMTAIVARKPNKKGKRNEKTISIVNQ
jgi:hypothetical protein